MANNPSCSENYLSPLVQLFTERAGRGTPTHPAAAMSGLIEEVRRGCGSRFKHRDPMQLFLEERKIRSIEIAPSLDVDGFVEPLGGCYADGFRIVLKKGASAQRMRFTLAHEVCHTFFYELVPELKFGVCSRDEHEERLCNHGAASLLIPNALLKRRASALAVCLESLCDLAESFSVSLSTMLLRLQATGFWQCQLSLWHRTVDGSFLLDRLYGGRQVPWHWEDESVLKTAWESCEPIFGRTFVSAQDRDEVRRYRPVSYQLRRYGSGIMALWGNGIRPSGNAPRAPLFEGCAGALQNA